MLLTLASLATQAQDVYEYATVVYAIKNVPTLFVSKSNGEYNEIPVDASKWTLNTNTAAALKYIAEMNKEGWELVSTNLNDGSQWYFSLKRKVK